MESHCEMGKFNWDKDPSVKYDGSGGGPPPGHVRRCQSRNRQRTQCGRWAIVGSQYCQFHGGRRPLTYNKMGIYSKRASAKLKQKLEELQELTADERIDLSEEIDVARVLAERAINMYDEMVIQEKGDARSKASAAMVLKDALRHVSELVAQHARVQAIAADKVSVHNLKWIADQVCKIIKEEIPDIQLQDRLIGRIEEMKLVSDELKPKVVLSIT